MRAMIFLAVVAATFVGCKKKSADDGVDGVSPAPSEPAKVYSIKFAKRQPGVKYHVTDKSTTTVTVTHAKGTESHTDNSESEYTEIEVGEGRINRSYRYARESLKDSAMKDLPYSGKMVVIEKSGDLYTFKVDGRQLNSTESKAISKDFKIDNQQPDTLPDHPVKVGETWEAKRDEVRRLVRLSLPAKYDSEKSKISGKLKKAYTAKDGTEWGSVETVVSLVNETAKTSTVTATVGREVPIDGSSADGTQTRKIVVENYTVDKQVGEVRTVLEINETRTVVTVASK